MGFAEEVRKMERRRRGEKSEKILQRMCGVWQTKKEEYQVGVPAANMLRIA